MNFKIFSSEVVSGLSAPLPGRACASLVLGRHLVARCSQGWLNTVALRRLQDSQGTFHLAKTSPPPPRPWKNIQIH